MRTVSPTTFGSSHRLASTVFCTHNSGYREFKHCTLNILVHHIHTKCYTRSIAKRNIGSFCAPVLKYSTQTEDRNLLFKHIQSRIKLGGPITVADYMKEVLTNSLSGYYMHRDVFGAAGDFITSPEISQMFGEMLGVWIVNEWMNHYSDKHIQIVELGPGRGTLAEDMLRVFSQFPAIKNKISVQLVEISPWLSRIQAAKLTGKDISEISEEHTEEGSEANADVPGEPYRQLTCKYGPEVSWFNSLVDVPEGLSCYIAHEFFDALPVHKFHRTKNGWREVMVDVDPAGDSLRFVLAPGKTPASVAYLHDVQDMNKDDIEVCPSAGLIVQEICSRIKRNGGFCLLADYGHTGEKGDTFRAFKNHKLHDPLVDPGSADLTADVDFSQIRKMTSPDVNVFGPITQAKFLHNMGIGYRLQTLLQSVSQDQWSSLISGYKMLTSPEQMGERFKFLCIMARLNDAYIPAGFVDLDLGGRQNN